MSLIVLYFLHSTRVLSFYIDVVLTLPIQWQSNVSDTYIINMQSAHCLYLVIYDNKCCLNNHKPTNWHSYLLYGCVTSSTTIHTWKGPGFKLPVAMPVHRDQIDGEFMFDCITFPCQSCPPSDRIRWMQPLNTMVEGIGCCDIHVVSQLRGIIPEHLLKINSTSALNAKRMGNIISQL